MQTISDDSSLASIRAQFPALQRHHANQTAAYFDGPGGTQVPQTVLDAMSAYLVHHNANTHWAFPTSGETDRILLEARRAVADLVGGAAHEIVFGANMTTLTYHLSRTLGRDLREGDEIVVTDLDHQANIAPWQALERERGVHIRVAPMERETGKLDEAALMRLLGPRTKLVAVGCASNALGTITDVRPIVEAAHAVGAKVFVDAVHYAAHAAIDVRAIGCDFLSCSAYKFYGPHVGILWGRAELLETLDVPKLPPAPDTAPERWETGTQNHEGIAGTFAAVDFLESLGEGSNRRERLVSAMGDLHDRSREPFEILWNGLAAIDGVKLFGPPPDAARTPTVGFTVKDAPAETVSRYLSENFGLFTSHGDFYASTVIEALGLQPHGLVRAGCACYTTREEVERLVEGISRFRSDA